MNATSRRMAAIAAAVVCLIGFGGIAWAVESGRTTGFDGDVIRFVQGRESASLTHAMKAFTFIGSTKPVIGIAVVAILLLGLALRRWREIVLLVCSLGGSTLLNSLAKSLFRRERPSLHRLIEETGFSFPSGHSMAAICLYGALVYILWRRIGGRSWRVAIAAVGIAVIALIGCSRIYLGVHYPSDVVGAYLLGGCWLAIIAAVNEHMLARAQVRRSSSSASAA